MNNNISKTKKKLTIIFTIVVSLVIIFLGISFFSLKYNKDLSTEKKRLNDLGERVKSGRINIESFAKFSSITGYDIKRKDNYERFDRRSDLKYRNPNPLAPLSYIVFKDDEIISYDIKVDIEDKFIEGLFNSSIIDKSFESNGFLVIKINNTDKNIIIFKNLRYSFYNYISDIFIFILVTLLFSSLLYFIGNRFVARTFIPVEENIKDMNDFIHNAGHELKTPISVIDSNIQFIKDIKKYDESLIDEMKNETKKLNSLIDSLIKLSDIGGLKVSREKINLKDIINEVLINSKNNISLKNIKIKFKIGKDIFIEANKGYFYILLSNLIGNAIKYNINNGKIDIFYMSGELVIKDSGIGISDNDINKIFDRFYKADISRNTEGFGIGLSLVKKIADIYNWKIKVESKENVGSSFIIKF